MKDGLPQSREDILTAEILKLRKALATLISCAGRSPEGPAWATPEAKRRNREMLDKAIDNACDCFPPDYNGLEEIAASN